jgi:hypothetical protein
VRLPLLAALTLILGCTATSGTAYADPAPERSAASSVFSDSTMVRCASGTTDLGVHDGYRRGGKIRIRLCAVNNLTGTVGESVPSSPYYIKGANGHAVVNSRVSGAVQAMVRDMRAAGLSPSAFSSYRSMSHQQDNCDGNARCRGGNHQLLAQPGWSNHQMGLAIDFQMPHTKAPEEHPGATCAAPASSPNNAVWKWLHAHAGHYGLKQYKGEAWHWEAAGANSC